MVVDGFRVPDGQLQKDEGISMELQPPVYFGAGKIQFTQACYNTCTYSKGEQYNEILSITCICVSRNVVLVFLFQGKFFPQKSVIGCIRYIRFNGVYIREPDVNHGGAPCFDGVVEEGAYFAGGGSHMILG